jgi:metal-responsive CopG/Arc/MetJ family transcriptional regulator
MKVRTSIILLKELLIKIDALTGKKRKRSEVIELALRDYFFKESNKDLNYKDIEIINANAEMLNKQTLETLELQSDLIRDYLENESSKRNE